MAGSSEQTESSAVDCATVPSLSLSATSDWRNINSPDYSSSGGVSIIANK